MMRSAHSQKGFTILELLMAMALFVIAAVSLAEALNLIGLTVVESIDEAELREKLRAVTLETVRDPALTNETRETNPDAQGLYFVIEVNPLDLKTQEGRSISNLFEVRIIAKRLLPGGRRETLDSAVTYANPNLL